MFRIEPKCTICHKEIKGNDTVYVKMKYPSIRGFTEIKAYLNNNGKLICEACYQVEENG